VRQRCVRACDTPQRTNTHPPQSQRMHAQQTIRPRNKPRARKMLASTIQISNNNPTPTPGPHTQTPTRPGHLRVRNPDRSPRPLPVTGTRPDSSEPQQCAPTHPDQTPGRPRPADADRPRPRPGLSTRAGECR